LASLSCAPPPELTTELAASVIRQEKLAEPVRTTFLNPMKLASCVSLTQYLVYCESAGLAELDWEHHDPPCGKFGVRLTDKGMEYFSDPRYTGQTGMVYTTKGWQVTLRTPIEATLIQVDRIEDLGNRRRKVHYTWKHEYDPVLAGCTRHSQIGTRQDAVVLTLSGGEWHLE
jgi:hypothetical protein